MTGWIDRLVQQLAEFLARWAAPGGILALAGASASGVRQVRHLPADHRAKPGRRPGAAVREGPIVLALAARRRAGGAAPSTAVEPAAALVSCSDTRYCWLHGHPWACCSGSDTSCPPGTQAGSFWSYCCGGRRIFFRDCCGQRSCPSGCPWCDNSSQPNWCGGAGGNHYVCTLSEDHGAC